MVFIGTIDDFDGKCIRPRRDTKMLEVRAFTTKGEWPKVELESEVAVSFRGSLVEQMRFIADAYGTGKKLRVTVEAVDA